jgi:leucyl-tRNA synthetase
MRVGSHSGEKVSDAKPKIKAEMIAAGTAYNYAEPEKRVVSRSGCECVVALADQWYLKYGEPEWQSVVKKHIESSLELYSPQTKSSFMLIIDWLHEWACSRSYGLGTNLPWDPQYVIESLSDSTIYMAYYTIAHLLQGPSNGAATAENASFLSGSKAGLAGIKAEELNDAVWNYIFLNKEFPAYPEGQTSIPKEKLDVLRNEFEYWYPLDLRVSGKDLIGNHLTMSLYNHTAIWPDQPEMWPRSFFTNGHVMIDHEKMSKVG